MFRGRRAISVLRLFLWNRKSSQSHGRWDSLGLDLVAVTLLVVGVAQAADQLFEGPEKDGDERTRA